MIWYKIFNNSNIWNISLAKLKLRDLINSIKRVILRYNGIKWRLLLPDPESQLLTITNSEPTWQNEIGEANIASNIGTGVNVFK